MKTYHPCLNEEGLQVEIRQPSTPSGPHHWAAPDLLATVIPNGAMPPQVNGLAIAHWRGCAGEPEWCALAGAGDVDEPPLIAPAGLAIAAGAVIVEPDLRVWLVAPSNRHGGYTATFPKGRVDAGASPRAAAVREVYEESGLKVQLTGHVADVRRTLTYTRYYLARRIGGNPADMGWETQAVHLAPIAQLRSVLTNKNDLPLIEAMEAWAAAQQR